MADTDRVTLRFTVVVSSMKAKNHLLIGSTGQPILVVPDVNTCHDLQSVCGFLSIADQ